MNYAHINDSILKGRDIDPLLVRKDHAFYTYLLNNKVAYYYAQELAGEKSETDQKILARGQAFNEQYFRACEAMAHICGQAGIEYLIFKTHRYIAGAVDGDIDVLVRDADFDRFLEVFRGEGFACVEDEPRKGKCEKDGYATIEPHVNISWRGNLFLEGEKAWGNTQKITYQNGTAITTASPDVELLAAAGELFFSPEYIDLFRLKSAEVLRAHAAYTGKAPDEPSQQLLDAYLAILDHLSTRTLEHKLPHFLPLPTLDRYIKPAVSTRERLEILFKNFAWKERYAVIDKLPFTHDWKI
jgi:hypothetical protein